MVHSCLGASLGTSLVTNLQVFWGLSELEDAGLLGHDGALVLRGELGHQLSDKSAGLLGVEVTHLLGDIHQGGDDLFVTLLLSLLCHAASSANLHRKLLARSIS